MTDRTREQVYENASYLRQVRPLDPEELCEYVEGRPHPGVVRQLLREIAPSLALVERDDGLFEPVREEPIHPPAQRAESLPDRIERAVEDCLVEQFGPGWPDGESGDRLRSAIREFKRRYLHGAPVTYDYETALGYAIYHLPAYFATAQYVLAELAEDGQLPGHLRVLDVGAGVGGPALGLAELVPDDALLEYHAVEPSEAAAVLEQLLDLTGRNVHTTVHRRPIEELDPTELLAPSDEPARFDLVLFANVLSELAEPETVLTESLEWLDPEGTVVAIAPADQNTATQLRQLERAAERASATVYAPTVRLWQNDSPESRSWSFRREPPLATPGFQRRLDEGERTEEESTETERRAGEFVNVDVQFAYSLLRLDDETAVTIRPDRSRVAKLADSASNVTERVDCVALKLSPDLAGEGNPLYLVGDGSELVDHFAVLTNESVLNRELLEANYGDALLFENVLVLWNDDERAYNLVVDGETVIERLAT